MKWFAFTISSVALINLLISPLAQAQSIAQISPTTVSGNGSNLEYRYVLDRSQNTVRVFEEGTNSHRFDIALADDATLRSFKPSSMQEKLANELRRIRSANKSAFSHSLKALPTESFIFFMAMGAVVAGQLVLNYSQNPTAMEQHIEHSLSPMGVIGFYTFMYSQGVTSNILAMYMKNPRFMHLIPYLGMTVGVFMQSYLSQIMMDPNVRVCAKTMLGGQVTEEDTAKGVDANPCDKAYEYLVLNKKLWEFAPGVVSMLLSSGMAAGLQSLAAKALGTKAAIRIIGVNLATFLTPGAIEIKGARLLLVKGLQIGVFAGLDTWINRKVTYMWKNMFDGKEFYDLQTELNADIKKTISLKWNDSESQLQKELKNFRDKMTTWRMTNLADIYESHQYWSDNVQEVTGMYNASYSFYSAFTTQVRNSKFQESAYRPLEYSFPLNGVVSAGANKDTEDLYYSHPGFMKGGQLETVKEAASLLAGFLDTEKDLYPRERKDLTSVLQLMSSEDEMKIGQGLQLFLKLRDDVQSGLNTSFNYNGLIDQVYNKLGAPYPTFGAGQGWVETYVKAPTNIQEFKGLTYARSVGQMNTRSIGDYFIMQMLCGADPKNENLVVRPVTGFKDKFLPPRLVPANLRADSCDAYGSLQAGNTDEIYRQLIAAPNGKNYRGSIPFLIENTISEALGNKDGNVFADWWAKTIEPHMQNRFKVYSKDYELLVVRMVQNINQSNKSLLNGRSPFYWLTYKPFVSNEAKRAEERKRFLEGGPIHNGALLSSMQELLTYLSVLDALISNQQQLTLDFSSVLSYKPQNANLKAVLAEYNKLIGLIKSIKVVQDTAGNERIQSNLENAQYEAPIESIQAAIAEVKATLGVGEDEASSALPKAKRQLIVSILEHMESLSTEVMMFGMMANAVSWDKLRNVKTVSAQQQQSQSEAESRLKDSRGMRMGH